MTRTRYALLICGIVLAGVFSYDFALMRTLRIVTDPNAEEFSLEAARAGTAATPFRYRVLVIWSIDGLLALLPKRAHVSSPLEVVFPLETAATFALLIALWMWLGEWAIGFYGRVLGMILSANALILTYLVSVKASHFYWYDIPSLLFFTAGLLAIKRNRLLLFYSVFVIGTLNKETTCFLSVAFLLFYWRQNRAAAIYHAGLQFLLWLIIKGMLCYSAGQSVTSTFWWTLPRNLRAASSLSEYDVWLLCSALGFLPIITLACWAFIDDDDAKRLAYGVSVPFAVGMLLVGWMEEIRIYGELLPVLLPAGVLGLQGALQRGFGSLARRAAG